MQTSALFYKQHVLVNKIGRILSLTLLLSLALLLAFMRFYCAKVLMIKLSTFICPFYILKTDDNTKTFFILFHIFYKIFLEIHLKWYYLSVCKCLRVNYLIFHLIFSFFGCLFDQLVWFHILNNIQAKTLRIKDLGR